jgi:transposase
MSKKRKKQDALELRLDTGGPFMDISHPAAEIKFPNLMKGRLRPGILSGECVSENPRDRKETAMKSVYGSVASAGLDVHYKFSSVTMRSEGGQVIRRERLDHPDRASLVRQLSGWPRELPVVMEASFGWSWLADLMKELGLQPHLSNCLKVEQMRKARGWAKTNKKDADLVSLLWAEPSKWWEVWLAPPEVRDRREVMRYRAGLVEMQTATKNRINAIFHRHGIFHEFSDLFGGKGREFLVELCVEGRWKDGQLDPGALMGLRGQVMLLDHLRKQLARIAKQFRQELPKTPLAVRLKSIPGIGLILSHVLISEIGQIERFGNHRRLASYSLLAPRADDTGEADPDDSPRGRHLGQAGNRTLKWAFIEAAHGAVRHGGRYRQTFDAYTEGGKKNRNRGYIKVARELVNAVVGVWKSGTMYTETPPGRPGSYRRSPASRLNRRARKSRSGTGQLCTDMVAARQGQQTSS